MGSTPGVAQKLIKVVLGGPCGMKTRPNYLHANNEFFRDVIRTFIFNRGILNNVETTLDTA